MKYLTANHNPSKLRPKLATCVAVHRLESKVPRISGSTQPQWGIPVVLCAVTQIAVRKPKYFNFR